MLTSEIRLSALPPREVPEAKVLIARQATATIAALLPQVGLLGLVVAADDKVLLDSGAGIALNVHPWCTLAYRHH
jgi:hypothetical protein